MQATKSATEKKYSLTSVFHIAVGVVATLAGVYFFSRTLKSNKTGTKSVAEDPSATITDERAGVDPLSIVESKEGDALSESNMSSAIEEKSLTQQSEKKKAEVKAEGQDDEEDDEREEGDGEEEKIEDESSTLPAKNEDYAKKEYWDSRFKNEGEYEWLQGYSDDLRNLLRRELNHNDNILAVGTGNSQLTAGLYDDGYEDILNIDFSDVVIQSQSARHSTARPNMTWKSMDMLTLVENFDANSFDVILDKCAMDALVVDEGDPWDPYPEVRNKVSKFLDGVFHTLKPGGKFILISFGQPHFRKGNYLNDEKYNWTVTSEPFGGGGGIVQYFFYVMQKATA